MTNTEKTLKNSTISVIARVLTLLLNFVDRRIFIIFLSIELLGYYSLFTNIFSFLSFAELGIGSIISFHLYKEVTCNNKKGIGKLMYLYKWIYRVIAIFVFFVGVLLIPFLHYFVNAEHISWNYLYTIYLLQLISIVAGYFLSYRRTIFIVTQQEFRCEQIDLYITFIFEILRIISLIIFKNYILYLVLQISSPIVANLIIKVKTDAEYPYINEKYFVDKKFIKEKNFFSDIGNFLLHRVAYLVYGSTDNIIISIFLGIKYVALYSNYVAVQTGVMSILFYKLLNPVQATIGNIIYSGRNKKDLWQQFEALDVFSFYFASYIGLGFFVFFQPFITLWMGKTYLLPNLFVAIFSLTIYLGAVFEIVYKYRSTFGDYKQDRWFMILSAIVNICISIPGAKFFGIVGIQFGTFIAFLFIAFGRIRFVVKKFFNKSISKYLFKHLLLTFVFVFECCFAYILTKNVAVSIIGLLYRTIIWLLIPLFINTLIFIKNPHFSTMMEYMKQIFFIAKSKAKIRLKKR